MSLRNTDVVPLGAQRPTYPRTHPSPNAPKLREFFLRKKMIDPTTSIRPGVETTEILVRRLVICGVIWTQLSAWSWGTRVWEVNDE